MATRKRTRSLLDEQAIATTRDALERNAGNIRVTAQALGMPRRTLYERLARWGLTADVERFRRKAKRTNGAHAA